MGELEDVSSDVLDGRRAGYVTFVAAVAASNEATVCKLDTGLEAIALELARDASFDFFVDAVDPDEMLRTEWDNEVGL